MSISLRMQDPVPVYVSPVNEFTSKWGVYSIPRLWRDCSGKLIIRLNGERDSALEDDTARAETLWFVSDDEGISWQQESDPYPIDCMQGISSPYLKLSCGDIIGIRERSGNVRIQGITPIKRIIHPCMEAILNVYNWRDIPKECRRLELVRYKPGTSVPSVTDIDLDFGEREVQINAAAQYDSNVNLQSSETGVKFIPVDEFLKPFIFSNNYISGLTELSDGTIAGICSGQSPSVSDRYCTELYMVTSSDGGITWTKRSNIAAVTNDAEGLALPYGYGGDGHESSMAITPDGELLCVMRMDLSINPETARPLCGTMMARSTDLGYTWQKPVPISDESVTPHVIALKNGITAIVYGRPGIHMIYSDDNMRTFSEPVSIIGETLWENRRKGISDLDSKYGAHSVSYANSFVEVISDDSFIVVYNDLTYDCGDGLQHKTTIMRRITLTKAR